ncbi:tRNA (cytosine(34)-2'-O)-methyltransferase TrmL [Anoxybacter fermentans]|uniref:Putative tRNA (cytidine(34)-2'-O)-methyltransferase n=1 Tax=Anoxybacter fermentans TaxID=1323375 RepID=A0A3Q9HPN1_9FIRM|nr:tRNA (uridine(34)/cytosine(34)/5-carboxymethylaminomethyluridine(34)-2'-O)-methyltransferase TrmL [Anoxybacter fermentans]AZR72835.1 tRNA (cytosine(34)-2'-O)-methyltransferase TrmL [Anoxybacter fermentans]
MHIVLVEPEIPPNTGNIARTCAVTNTSLHLVGKLGFSTDDKYLKRAGLDYWHLLDIHYYDSFSELEAKYPNSRFFMATTKGKYLYTDVTYGPDDFIVFGKETAGLPQELLDRYTDTTIRIPMLNNPKARSLNLSNSVAIILYEALRQQNFPNLK